MPELELSPIAQHWVYAVLVWVGFGTLAGLVATVILPLRQPAGPFSTMVMGIAGSTLGLLGLAWLFPGREMNPISPLGFLATIVGAFVLLVVYRLGCILFTRRSNGPKEGQ
jgi:uncharacterized membrane protein YeaQ/YmgE (transglycosylase-associated protein family)